MVFLLFTLKLSFDFGGLVGINKATIVKTVAVIVNVVALNCAAKLSLN